jgi:hypothetical protein
MKQGSILLSCFLRDETSGTANIRKSKSGNLLAFEAWEGRNIN